MFIERTNICLGYFQCVWVAARLIAGPVRGDGAGESGDGLQRLVGSADDELWALQIR